jgi:hypothetical protein
VIKGFTILDERGNWHGPAIETAQRRGYSTSRIKRGREATEKGSVGLGFLRPHAIPAILERNHLDWWEMADRLIMVQDFRQIELYDDKSAQFWAYENFMPPTRRFGSKETAFEFARNFPLEGKWIVSKADVGASSKNVRILRSRRELVDHLRLLFGKGVEVDHCAGGGEGRHSKGVQRGYALLQEYIPHAITWRVNAIGRGRALFKRYNAPGTFVAQTGNVEPVTVQEMLDSAIAQDILAFANGVFSELNTNWCALDILREDETGRIYLLETSVGWPWPSPGTCMEGPFFGPIERPRKWAEMWDLMLDEYEAGTWTAEPIERYTTSGSR